MRSKLTLHFAVLAVFALTLTPAVTFAHCQIPCGIYDDEARFGQLEEVISTIEKAMTQITELSQAEPVNYNQLVRWVTNKDAQADDFEEIISYYFLAQRIKEPADESGRAAYLEKLASLHRLTVGAMKCKQSTDLAQVEALRKELQHFHDLYFAK